ncbi:MAG: PaaI family thioesterase [Methanomicrobiaceae archaeon]|nr:PaaI family thioesterase [Methanomicrobiaceae archaeon]
MSENTDIDKAKEFFAADSFAQENGMELMEVSPGRATVSMKVEKRHKNSHGTVHGGALFTLADCAFALASNSHGIPAAAINAHISYMTAARDGILTAHAEEFSLNPKLASYTVTVTDENNNKIAIFQGMVYRKTLKQERKR